jgi:sterol desaturase/sphingolipid hydroxylase (fatty acid hydroxylase superfamily)
MAAFFGEHAWFLFFWGMIALLGTIEFMFPQFREPADRIRRWPTNFGLGILNGLIVSAFPVLAVASAQWAESNGVGLLNWLSAPWWIALPCTVLVRSLGHYGIHVASHKIPLVWRFHRVHHCDVHLDVSSALRSHPLEMIAISVVMIPVNVLLGLSPVVLAVYEGVEVLANILTHANIRVPQSLERGVRWLVMTPSLHRLHHSAFQAETDSNYGNVFSFWDRLFGTYRGGTIQPDGTFRFGLDDVSPERAGNFQSQLKLPWG